MSANFPKIIFPLHFLNESRVQDLRPTFCYHCYISIDCLFIIFVTFSKFAKPFFTGSFPAPVLKKMYSRMGLLSITEIGVASCSWIVKKAGVVPAFFQCNIKVFRRRLTFPGGCPRSIISAEGLNGRVRDGNGWCPFAIATGKVYCDVVDAFSSALD